MYSLLGLTARRLSPSGSRVTPGAQQGKVVRGTVSRLRTCSGLCAEGLRGEERLPSQRGLLARLALPVSGMGFTIP